MFRRRISSFHITVFTISCVHMYFKDGRNQYSPACACYGNSCSFIVSRRSKQNAVAYGFSSQLRVCRDFVTSG